MLLVLILFRLDYIQNDVKITPDQLYCNSFIIPRFNNISLEYEMTGDFQKYITNIDIIALKKLDKKGFLVDDAYKFKAVFLFNNLVETGLLKVNIYEVVKIDPNPTDRGQDKRVQEMISNIGKLKEDVKELKEAFDDIILGQKSIEILLEQVEKRYRIMDNIKIPFRKSYRLLR